MTKIHFRPYIPNQTVLFPQRIDEDIAENDPVRMVDALVEGLNLERDVYKRQFLYRPKRQNTYHRPWTYCLWQELYPRQ